MEKSFFKILLILIFFNLFLTAFPVLAQVPPPTCQPPCPADAVICIPNPLKACSLEDLINGVIDFIWMVATALVPLMIVIAAFYFLTAAGNPRQIETAKTIILYTLVGYAIILISKGLILVIRDILGG